MKKYVSILIICLLLSLCFSVNSSLANRLEETSNEHNVEIDIDHTIPYTAIIGTPSATITNHGNETVYDLTVNLTSYYISFFRLELLKWAAQEYEVYPIDLIERGWNPYKISTKLYSIESLAPNESMTFDFNRVYRSGEVALYANLYIDGIKQDRDIEETTKRLFLYSLSSGF